MLGEFQAYSIICKQRTQVSTRSESICIASYICAHVVCSTGHLALKRKRDNKSSRLLLMLLTKEKARSPASRLLQPSSVSTTAADAYGSKYIRDAIAAESNVAPSTELPVSSPAAFMPCAVTTADAMYCCLYNPAVRAVHVCETKLQSALPVATAWKLLMLP
eukprot:953-Heterococcus_DN1.PRE.2